MVLFLIIKNGLIDFLKNQIYNKEMKYENIKNYKPEAEQDNGAKN